MEDILIVEFVKDCKLVRQGTEDNGHDCWGNLEYTSFKYIYLDGKEHRLADHWWVIHDGKEVKEFRIPALPPDVEYQERAVDFNYGWTPTTEKDYNNQKAGFEYRMILKTPATEDKKAPVDGDKQPYFKLSRNEHGKAWLFYKPCGDGRYNCWEPIDEEFYSEFEKLLKKDS